MVVAQWLFSEVAGVLQEAKRCTERNILKTKGLCPCARLRLRLRLVCFHVSKSTSRFAGIQSGVRCGTRVRTLTLGILCCTAQNEGVDGACMIWVFGVVDAGIFPHEVNHELYMVVFQVYFQPHDQWRCTWTQPRSNNWYFEDRSGHARIYAWPGIPSCTHACGVGRQVVWVRLRLKTDSIATWGDSQCRRRRRRRAHGNTQA